MTWMRRAITACAVVTVLAGAVFAVTGAAAADDASPQPARSTVGGATATSGSASADVDASSAYRSRVTITLDGSAESCASFPDAGGSGRPHRVCGPVLVDDG